MTRFLFIFALILLSAFSCSKDEDVAVDPLEKYPAPVSRVEAPAAAAIGETVILEVHFIVNNGCGQFGTFDVATSGKLQTIKVFPKYREGFCTLDLPTRKTEYTFKPNENGIYTFRFWSGINEEYITKTIEVGNSR